MTTPGYDSPAIYDATTQINTAVATLTRLCLPDQAYTIIEAARQSTNYDAIANDTSRSDSWKLQAYAKNYIAAWTGLAVKLTAAANRASTQDQSDAATVFGVKGLSGDPASLTISLRDAQDRLADVTDAATRQRIMAAAIRSNDQTMARAAVESAINFADLDTVNMFVAAYPTLESAGQRLWDTMALPVKPTKYSAILIPAVVAAMKPAALTGKTDYEIQAIADGNTTAGTWNAR